jgi:hypothetical protein
MRPVMLGTEMLQILRHEEHPASPPAVPSRQKVGYGPAQTRISGEMI